MSSGGRAKDYAYPLLKIAGILCVVLLLFILIWRLLVPPEFQNPSEQFSDSPKAPSAITALPGADLFKRNCTPCHKLGAKLIGPDLIGIRDRKPEEWIIHFVRNSQEVIKSGDPYAVNLFEEYNRVIMPPQPLNRPEVLQVLDYIDSVQVKQIAPVAVQ